MAVVAADRPLAVVRAALASGRLAVIDGRSGAGKTTLARSLQRSIPDAQLVSLDEVYPGWEGLAEGARIARDEVIVPYLGDAEARYRRFDWESGSFRGSEIQVHPHLPLIVEGCGALIPGSAPTGVLAVWVDGTEQWRRERAFARDGESFRPYWDSWAAQEREHLALHDPTARADVVIHDGVIIRRP